MTDAVDDFIERWRPSSGSEMANFQSLFLRLGHLQ